LSSTKKVESHREENVTLELANQVKFIGSRIKRAEAEEKRCHAKNYDEYDELPSLFIMNR
jgi:hypothetical protein